MLYDLAHALDDPGALFLVGDACLFAMHRAVVGKRQLVADGGLVEAHDRHEQNGVRYAVGDVVFAAERVTQRMHCRRAGAGNGDAAVERGDLHLTLGVERFGIVAGALDVVEDAVKGVERERVAERVGLVAREALDSVRHGVHAARRGDLARQVLDHARIENDIVGDHRRVHDADLQLLFRHSDDGVRRRFGARPGGRRDEAGRHGLFAAERIVQKILHRIFVGYEDARELRGVHRAAAADGDDDIRAQRAELVNQCLHRAVARLGGYVGEDHGLHTGGPDDLLRQIHKTRAENSLVGEDRGLFTAGDDLAEIFQRIHAAVGDARQNHIVLIHFSSVPFVYYAWTGASLSSRRRRSVCPKPPDLESTECRTPR